MSQQSSQPDFFDRARRLAVAGMLAAGAAGIIGALLDWVTITELPTILPESELPRAQPVSGIDTSDGIWVIVMSVLVIDGAILLWWRRRGGWAWLGFLASIITGAIGIADYRAIGDESSGLLQDLEVVGKVDHGIGILLVAAAGLLGVIFSLIGVAATPRRQPRLGEGDHPLDGD